MASTIYPNYSPIKYNLTMEDKIIVSIIIPVYKVETYIHRCLESIFHQEIEGTLLECIIVDDCSPDNSIAIAKKLIESYSGNILFRIIAHSKNSGLSAARNTGIRAAKGDFLIFVDSDDYLEDNSIHTMLQALKQHPEADSVVCNYYDCKEKKVPFPIETYEYLPNKDVIMERFYETKIKSAAWNKIVRREQIINNNIFFVEGLLNEDVLWSYRQFTTSSSIIILPDITYIYEYNPQSIVNTTSKKSQANINSFLYISDKLMEEPYQGHFVNYMLFVFSYLIKALFLMLNFEVTEEQYCLFKVNRKKLLIKALKDYRIILASFYIILYKPFSFLLNVNLFRSNYDRQAKLVALIENSLNILHPNYK